MREAFAVQKLLTFFQQKIPTNDVVSFEQPGPDLHWQGRQKWKWQSCFPWKCINLSLLFRYLNHFLDRFLHLDLNHFFDRFLHLDLNHFFDRFLKYSRTWGIVLTFLVELAASASVMFSGLAMFRDIARHCILCFSYTEDILSRPI